MQQEHAAIMDTLEKIKALGLQSPEARELLKRARSVLLALIEMEDTELYPVPWQAAKSDVRLRQISQVGSFPSVSRSRAARSRPWRLAMPDRV